MTLVWRACRGDKKVVHEEEEGKKKQDGGHWDGMGKET